MPYTHIAPIHTEPLYTHLLYIRSPTHPYPLYTKIKLVISKPLKTLLTTIIIYPKCTFVEAEQQGHVRDSTVGRSRYVSVWYYL